MLDAGDIRCRFLRLEPFLDERGRRLFAANEALSLGRGGVSAVSSAIGIARSTTIAALPKCRQGTGQTPGYASPARGAAGRKSASLDC